MPSAEDLSQPSIYLSWFIKLFSMVLENLWGMCFKILDKFPTFPSVSLDRALMQPLSVMNNLLFSHKIRINPFLC